MHVCVCVRVYLCVRAYLHVCLSTCWCRIEFYDAITEEEAPPAEGAELQGQGAWSQHRPFATKILHLIDPVAEFAQSHYHMANSEDLTSHFQGTMQPISFPHEVAPAHRRWSPFAMATGEVEVKLKVKQQDEFAGHKVSRPASLLCLSCACHVPVMCLSCACHVTVM